MSEDFFKNGERNKLFIYRNQLTWSKDGDRKFVTTPDGVRREYVSPSSELKRTADMSWHDAWIKKVGKTEADRIGKEARTAGTATHEIIETKQDSEKLGSWLGTGKFVTQECALWLPLADGRWLFGFSDALITRDGYNVAVDFKTAKKPKKEEWAGDAKMQVSLYCAMAHHTYGLSFQGAEVVYLLPEGEPQIFRLNRQAIRMNLNLFWRRTKLSPLITHET